MVKNGRMLLLLVGIVSVIIAICDLPLCFLICFPGLALVLAKYWSRIYVGLVTLPRDLRLIHRLVAILLDCKRYQRNNDTVVSLFRHQVQKNPRKPCFHFEDKVWTFAEVDEFSSRLGNVLLSQGHEKGDVVGLFMAGRPEYVCTWLGLAKIGCVAMLVNSNVRGPTLLHSLQVTRVRSLVFGADLAPVLSKVLPSLPGVPQLYQLGGTVACFGLEMTRVHNLDRILEAASPSQPRVEQPNYEDNMLYIFTSGTTGLPKAAIIPHSRFLLVCSAARHMLALRPDDVVYNPLPLYHSGGGIVGIGPTLVYGLQTVIRAKFSASAYFADCCKYNCTVGQYIGEMCRYILASPPKPDDTRHKVRLMAGNGMRPFIWQQFVERFQVPQICELYGATEGNSNLVNIDNTIGAVGFLPRCVPKAIFPVALIRVHPDTCNLVRDEKGLCIRCEIDEPGMYIGLISDSVPLRQYHGYVDKAASEQKVITNVFKVGDKAFMSGDILVMDKFGYFYFRNRAGETYRWKGENVSTAEVEAVLSKLIGLRDVAVYGVEVQENEGRVGMATIVDDGSLDLQRLAGSLDEALPSYAQPLFIRVSDNLDLTETFKIKKTALQKEGFNPYLIKDRVYFRMGDKYTLLTTKLYNEIISGSVRL